MSLLNPLRSQIFANGSEFYEISDEYDASVTGFLGDYEYFGFVNNLGKWIIQSHQISTGQYRYVNGDSNYATAWTNKGILVYAYYYQMVDTSP